jgi:hypothetical protein
MKELIEALSAYLGHVQTNLSAHEARVRDERQPYAGVSPTPATIKEWFETLEKSLAWNNLTKTCTQRFGQERRGEEQRWKSRIRNWMRLKGTYLPLLDGAYPNPVEVAEALATDIGATEDRVVFLAPLEGLGFAKTEMNLGDFQILQPTTDQLEAILGMRANRLFYPYATTSTERLTDHWYVRYEMKEQQKWGRTYPWFLDTFGGPVLAQYTDLPPRIEALIKSIILWDEQEHGLGIDYWMRFVSIPFVIEVSDNPFRSPRAAPPIGAFTSYRIEIIDGKEWDVESEKILDLDAAETDRFEVFVRGVSTQLQSIRSLGEVWGFMDLGLDYLLKGFFSDGLEQILWHIVSLKAFLGENGRGITDRLIRRVGPISSADLKESRAARKTFTCLDRVRNDLVHGRVQVLAHSHDLWEARRLGRTVAKNMIRFLSGLADEVNTGRLAPVPTREEVLEVLDLNSSRKGKHVVSPTGRQADLQRVFVNS